MKNDLKAFNNPAAMKMFVEAHHAASKDALELLGNMEPWSQQDPSEWILSALRIGQHMGEIKLAEDFMRTFNMPFDAVLDDKELLDKLGVDLGGTDSETP